MADRISKERRSWNMSRIRSRDTRPEVLVRSLLHREGFRFRLHDRKLPGRPDIVLPKYRTALFVHGCFWHRHERCAGATMPSTNTSFWHSKFEATVLRDQRTRHALEELGWHVMVVWECTLKSDAPAAVARIARKLKQVGHER